MGGNRTLIGGGPISTREGFGSGVIDAMESVHHSDELLLGPTKAIREFILDGDIRSIDSVLDMLNNQKNRLKEIDFKKVDRPSYLRFLNACDRLNKVVTDLEIGWNNIIISMGFSHLGENGLKRNGVNEEFITLGIK